MVRRILGIIIVLLILIPSNLIMAQEDYSVPNEYEDIEDALPEDVTELLPDGIFSNNTDEIIEGVKIISDWNYLIDFLFDTIGLNIKDIIKTFAIILSLLLICSLLNMFRNTLNNQATDGVIGLVTNIATASLLVEISRTPLSRAMTLLENLKLFVNSISPCITAMYAMGGNITSALIHNYGFIVFLSIMENICIVSLEMIVGICMALALSAAFTQESNLLSLSNGIKNIFSFIWIFITIIFTTVISTQSLLATKADNLSSKTAKMLATQIIPLAGGTIGESLRTAGASIEYLRTNVGVVFVIVLVIMIAPTLISIFLYRLVFIISHSISGMIGTEREGRVILEISSIYGYVLAVIGISSIILLFLITVFAKCASPLS